MVTASLLQVPVKVAVYAGAEEEPPAQLDCSSSDKRVMMYRSALCPAPWPVLSEQITEATVT